MSGWSTLRTPICAPRLCPELAIVWQIESNIPIKDTGPEDLESKDLMRSPFGRSNEKSYPIPPPLLIVSAASEALSIMFVIESSIVPDTKQL